MGTCVLKGDWEGMVGGRKGRGRGRRRGRGGGEWGRERKERTALILKHYSAVKICCSKVSPERKDKISRKR